ncbi:MAG: anthranilate synthase component I [Longispora sp.]|nr:anthranilate synthase component I [Longispora sp. (in: high G+C Gram-positive bacteria)]
MTSGDVSPNLDEFRELAAARRVIPVTRRLLADSETPVGVYRALAGGPGTFLLESAEAGGVWSRYSFIGVRSLATLTERDGQAVWSGGDLPSGVPLTGDPLDILRTTVDVLASPRVAGLPSLTGGLVGYLAYDVVRRLETLPSQAVDDLHLPEMGLMLATELAVLDHVDGSILLVSNAILPPIAEREPADITRAYIEAHTRLDEMSAALDRPVAPMVATMTRRPAEHFVGRTPEGGYTSAVEAAKEAIRAGECFQVVPSQRFETDTTADALDVYRALRATNPSPYMYLLRFEDFDIVGSSPEAHVKVTGQRALLHPIAGTRPRGTTPEADGALAAELIGDPKERAEHVMLVDLGRNDLGRVCVPGSVHVPEFFQVERYSHVMHIVSTVVGELTSEHTAVDALLATFPAGTLTGAPKVRAMELIESWEPTRRGLYGGTVGYVDFAGDLDMAIAIRTALLRDGRAYVQAGAGVVADSVPAAEDAETRSKAAAVLSAIASAETMRPVAQAARDWQGTG